MKKTLEITTRLGCAVDCSFCPQSALKAAYKSEQTMLTGGDFALALSKLPKDVEIHFSGFAEPFLNPAAGQLICYAAAKGFKVHLYTTLVGFGSKHLLYLETSPIDYLRIHVPDEKAFVFDTGKWIYNFELFEKTGHKMSLMAMGPLRPDLRDYFVQRKIPVEVPTMLSRGGNLWGVTKPTGHITCTMDRWHSNVLLPNGDVYGDCMDYGLTVPLGNLFQQTYEEIYEAAEQWRLSFKDEKSICASCEWAA